MIKYDLFIQIYKIYLDYEIYTLSKRDANKTN